ncbi:MAG TPA: beta-propeller fold lactonase family protein [Candidatus Saccharimonadales bacterium]|jgi:hypothetical protein|nr:beta-propeller fold lactonase family protein [Candidatus Saccharimonadales bacterium]
MRILIKAFLIGIILATVCMPLAAQSNQPLYIYVPNGSVGGNGGIFSAFKADPTTGALSVVPGSPFQAGGGVGGVAVDPAGRFVYVSSITNDGSKNWLWVFSVDQTTGSLTPLLNSPFPGGGGAIAMDPTGRFLYADDMNPSNSGFALQVYSIDPVSGVPTQLSGSPFPGATPSILTVDPSGNFLYFQSPQSNQYMTTESIDFETGVPTIVDYTVIITSGDPGTPWVAVDPLDRFIATNGTQIFRMNPIYGYPTNPALPAAASGTSVFDPSGRFL